jgi:RimJ/RimL family protein N-acetyltransferase
MIWPPPDRPLEGSLVRMEPLIADHFDDLRQAADDERIWAWMDRRIPAEDGSFERWFEGRLGARELGTDWPFATFSVSEGRAVGSSSYLSVRAEHDGLEIGHTWLSPEFWRTGANAEAKLLMLAFAFDELGCIRVEFKTDSRNERSRAALEGIGASFEGIFRKHMLTHVEGVRDSAYYSITDEDWPEVKSRLESRREVARA